MLWHRGRQAPLRPGGHAELTRETDPGNVSQVAPRPKAASRPEARARVMFENSTVCHADGFVVNCLCALMLLFGVVLVLCFRQ